MAAVGVMLAVLLVVAVSFVVGLTPPAKAGVVPAVAAAGVTGMLKVSVPPPLVIVAVFVQVTT